MPDDIDDPKLARMARGTVNKGLGARPDLEHNVPLGNVVALVPNRLYNVIGFDIASADVTKPGIREGLEPIVKRLLATPDPRPTVVITGHASESRLKGKGPEFYERARAAALKDYLVSRGINQGLIQTTTSGSRALPANSYSASQKAAARAATIEVKYSGQTRGVGRTSEPARIMPETRPQRFKLTRFGISEDAFQHFRDAQETEPMASEWTIKQGIDIERHSLRWVERGPQYTSKMSKVLLFKSIKSWGESSKDTASQINVEVEDEARRRVFRFLADSDPSFRDLVQYKGAGDYEAGLRQVVNSNFAK